MTPQHCRLHCLCHRHRGGVHGAEVAARYPQRRWRRHVQAAVAVPPARQLEPAAALAGSGACGRPCGAWKAVNRSGRAAALRCQTAAAAAVVVTTLAEQGLGLAMVWLLQLLPKSASLGQAARQASESRQRPQGPAAAAAAGVGPRPRPEARGRGKQQSRTHVPWVGLAWGRRRAWVCHARHCGLHVPEPPPGGGPTLAAAHSGAR